MHFFKCYPGTKVKSALWQIIVTSNFFHVFILNHNLCVVIKDKTKERYTTYQQKRTKINVFCQGEPEPYGVLYLFRQNPLPNDDRLNQSLDAGYFFP